MARIGDEFHGTRPFVSDRPCGGNGRRADPRARRGVHPRGRRLLDHFLVAPLDGAIALKEMNDVTVTIGKDLHLDMPRSIDILLEENPVIAESRRGLALRRCERRAELRRRRDFAHTLATASGDRLDQDRPPDGSSFAGETCFGLVLAEISGRGGHACLVHQPLGRVLAPHGSNRGGRRAHPNQAGGNDRFGKISVLRKEAIPRVYGFSARLLGGLEDSVLRKIAVLRRRGPDGDGRVRLAYMRGGGIRLGVNRYRAHAEPPSRAHDAAGDFPAIGDKEAADHAVTSGRRRRPFRGWARSGWR